MSTTPSVNLQDQQSRTLVTGDQDVPSKQVGVREKSVDGSHNEPRPAIQPDHFDDAVKAVGSGDISQTADEASFQSAPSQQLFDPAESSYQEPASEELLPPPDFRPFYTLIEDAVTSEHHHPTVCYLFSDDDPEVFTNAALQTLDGASGSGEQQAAIEDRIVLVDMSADGKEVATAASLSPYWQVVRADVMQAPSWGENAPGVERGLMLKVSGQQAFKPVPEKSKKTRSTSLEDLVKIFGDRLFHLDEALTKYDVAADERSMQKQE